ncbi:MAG: hypothetical protein LC642_06845 [Verrucomicrobiaceae bacterium]|nr:hypothetical protein [Verrucomicrobiaceae bacterium]
MNMLRLFCWTALFAVFTASAAVTDAQIVRSAVGANAAAITPARDAFRMDLGGGTTAGANGSFGGLRREINWDGVPDSFSSPNALPGNFFNVNSPRGAVFSTPGSGFQVSATAASGTSVEFGNIDPSYTGTFATFSPQRLFTAIGSNIVDVSFFLPGSTVPALTRGFGSVFTDVDLPNTTSIEFFDRFNFSLGIFFVPAMVGTETLSFLGVSFATDIIARVRITNGNFALGPGLTDQNGNPRDGVAMDDFIYGETVAAPESGLGLVGLIALAGLLCVAEVRRRRAVV